MISCSERASPFSAADVVELAYKLKTVSFDRASLVREEEEASGLSKFVSEVRVRLTDTGLLP